MNAPYRFARKADGRPAARGFTLVELMVAMLLGLIVIAGVSSVFLANVRSYHSNVALSNVQSNARIAFELMAREIRQAGLTGCNSRSPRIANVLNAGPNSGGTKWWANLQNAVRGYDDSTSGEFIAGVTTGSGTGQRVAGTDSLMLIGAMGHGASIGWNKKNAANFKLTQPNTNLQTGDIIVACDPDHATVLQITKMTGSNTVVIHNTGNKVQPGNCSKGMGYPTTCTSNGNQYQYGPNSVISKLGANYWYIGNNPVQGRSLYRVRVSDQGSATNPQAQEMVRNVTDMQITYHHGSATALASASSSGITWATVDAVHVTYTLESANQRAGTDAEPLTRTYAATTTLRNRM